MAVTFGFDIQLRCRGLDDRLPRRGLWNSQAWKGWAPSSCLASARIALTQARSSGPLISCSKDWSRPEAFPLSWILLWILLKPGEATRRISQPQQQGTSSSYGPTKFDQGRLGGFAHQKGRYGKGQWNCQIRCFRFHHKMTDQTDPLKVWNISLEEPRSRRFYIEVWSIVSMFWIGWVDASRLWKWRSYIGVIKERSPNIVRQLSCTSQACCTCLGCKMALMGRNGNPRARIWSHGAFASRE